MTYLIAEVDGQKVFIQADVIEGSEETSSIEKILPKDALERAKTTITTMAETLVSAIRKIDAAITPDEFQIEFAVKFTAEGNAVVTKMGSEAVIKVGLIYKHRK